MFDVDSPLTLFIECPRCGIVFSAGDEPCHHRDTGELRERFHVGVHQPYSVHDEFPGYPKVLFFPLSPASKTQIPIGAV